MLLSRLLALLLATCGALTLKHRVLLLLRGVDNLLRVVRVLLLLMVLVRLALT